MTMDKSRLEELRVQLEERNLDFYGRRDLIALIDSALAEPDDAAVAEAIEEILAVLGCDDSYSLKLVKIRSLAEQVSTPSLRQMKPEPPCEWCDGKQKYHPIDENHSWNLWRYMDGHYQMHVWEMAGNFAKGIAFTVTNCPNCGRKLVE